MSALAWFLQFAVGNIVGVIAFLFVDIGHLSAGLWIVMAWFPISWFYCIILLMASRLVGFLRIASIPYGAGFTVALFPLVSGGWPTYWAELRFAIRFVGVRLVVLSVVIAICAVSCRLFSRKA